jgi:hypothetical protein
MTGYSPQCRAGIDGGGPPGGQVARHHRDDKQQYGRGEQARDVGRLDAVYKSAHHLGADDSQRDAHSGSRDRHRRSLPDHQASDIAPCCTERDANAELAKALRDPVRHHAVDANRRQQECERAEAGHQDGRDTSLRQRSIDDLRHRTDVEDRLIGIDRANCLHDGAGERR